MVYAKDEFEMKNEGDFTRSRTKFSDFGFRKMKLNVLFCLPFFYLIIIF